MSRDRQLPTFTPGVVAPQLTTYRWATVVQVDPFRIRFDGDTTALPMAPSSLVDPLSMVVGQRAWVQIYGRRLIVLGVFGGPGGPPQWHVIDDPGEPTFQNSWVEYATNPFGTCAFSRVGWRVHLRGLTKLGTSGAGDSGPGVVFVLPEGFHPRQQELFIQWSNAAGSARVDVYPNGAVAVVGYGAGGTNGFVSLAGITFDWDGVSP